MSFVMGSNTLSIVMFGNQFLVGVCSLYTMNEDGTLKNLDFMAHCRLDFVIKSVFEMEVNFCNKEGKSITKSSPSSKIISYS